MTKPPVHRILLAAVAVALMLGLTTTPASAATPTEANASIARFEGKTIDLRKGWGDARACTSDAITTECFRSEAEMDRFLASEGADDLTTLDSIQATCSSSVRLYDGTSYGGSVLNLSTRGTWLNLSTWGFSDRTSSYKIGACSSYLADYTGGGGEWYPGSSAAWAQVSVMSSGWSNRISSVYIN